MTGRLVAIVGPSGVGKDSVMQGLVDRVADLSLVKRTITRAPGLGGEDYEAVLEQEFDMRAASGQFCLHWEAHGLKYGVPDTVRARVARGEHLLVNLSRSVLLTAQDVFPDLLTLSIVASPDVLEKRLQDRGRETLADVRRRLARATWPLSAGVNFVEINNDGRLTDTIDRAIDAIYQTKVAS